MKRSVILLISFLCLAVDGQTPRDIRLLVRGDDMGSSHASNAACLKAYTQGILRSVELMVPCPWFPEAVQWLNEHPALDAGIHLVLTSEWSGIKWRPLTCCPSLVDVNGYFYPMVFQRQDFPPGTALNKTHWNIQEVEQEFRAQIETALRNVPHITHVNCHMACENCAPSIDSLIQSLAREYHLIADPLPEEVMPLMLWSSASITVRQRKKEALSVLGKLSPGTYMFVDHPGLNTSELQAYEHPGYENVAADRDAVTKVLTHRRIKGIVQAKKISLISYRDIKESR
jgi:hypothetical protein